MKKILCIFLLALFVSSGMQAQKKKSFWDRVNRAIDKTGRAIDKTLDVADELLGGSNSSSKPRPTAEVKVGDVLIQQYGNNQIFQFEYGGTYRQSHKPHDVYVAFRVTNLNEFDYDLYYEPYSNNTYSLIAIDEKGTKYTFDCAFENGLDNKLYNNCNIPGEDNKAIYFKFEEVSKYINKFENVYFYFTPYRKGKYGDKFAIVLNNVDIEVIDTNNSTSQASSAPNSYSSSRGGSSSKQVTVRPTSSSPSSASVTSKTPSNTENTVSESKFYLTEDGVGPIKFDLRLNKIPNRVDGLYSVKIKDVDDDGVIRGFYLSNTSNKNDAILHVRSSDATYVEYIFILKNNIFIKGTNIQVGTPESELLKVKGIERIYQDKTEYIYYKYDSTVILIYCKNNKVTSILAKYEIGC